jgi:GTP-binding protein Era
MSTEARLDMQNYFEKKVFLNTWVKVKSGWSDSEQSLNQLGYTE